MTLFIRFGRQCSVPVCLTRTLKSSGSGRGSGRGGRRWCRPPQRKASTRAEDGSGSSSSNGSTSSKTVHDRPGGEILPSVVNPSPVRATATTAAITTATATATLLEAIRSGPLGRLGRLYEDAQKRRPYLTQVASAFVIYLLGDLSAQLFFPTIERVKAVNEKRDGLGDASAGTYDPLRTMRHLIVGLGMSIPSYKW